ncbi:4453_t:CDS:1, partial [Entrophospora sp. SA101]
LFLPLCQKNSLISAQKGRKKVKESRGEIGQVGGVEEKVEGGGMEI